MSADKDKLISKNSKNNPDAERILKNSQTIINNVNHANYKNNNYVSTNDKNKQLNQS